MTGEVDDDVPVSDGPPTSHRTDLTAAQLRSILDYDPDTGHFTWITQRRGQTRKRAGYTNPSGYLIIKLDQVNYRAYRLTYLHVHGR